MRTLLSGTLVVEAGLFRLMPWSPIASIKVFYLRWVLASKWYKATLFMTGLFTASYRLISDQQLINN
jgi:hypothetical protein